MVMPTNVWKLNLDLVGDDYYRAIGLIIAQWSYIEFICGNGIMGLMGATDLVMGRIAISGMQARTMLHLFRTLSRAKFPDKRKEIERIWERLDRALEYRNIVAHGVW